MTTAKKSAAKKPPAKKSATSADNCWPGFEPVPGKAANEKGSCKPKAKQTGGEKKADSHAAASKREKGGK